MYWCYLRLINRGLQGVWGLSDGNSHVSSGQYQFDSFQASLSRDINRRRLTLWVLVHKMYFHWVTMIRYSVLTRRMEMELDQIPYILTNRDLRSTTLCVQLDGIFFVVFHMVMPSRVIDGRGKRRDRNAGLDVDWGLVGAGFAYLWALIIRIPRKVHFKQIPGRWRKLWGRSSVSPVDTTACKGLRGEGCGCEESLHENAVCCHLEV